MFFYGNTCGTNGARDRRKQGYARVCKDMQARLPRHVDVDQVGRVDVVVREARQRHAHLRVAQPMDEEVPVGRGLAGREHERLHADGGEVRVEGRLGPGCKQAASNSASHANKSGG